ncbi:MAG: ImmA/IrrE family metallo-endopeptidase [Dehalococcoidia bacterium]|nr:ImmA/IrrE family metallo-endopeptidase [Dehalococcoidia bacterium]MCK4580681.1 ImmA/IrrE family metallo-endopeptidase [Dehalococcoidia bacterium]
MSGKAAARRARKKFGSSDPEAIAQKEGLQVVVTHLPERWWDILLWDCIAIRDDLPPKWQRWCLAHCLGHHFLHHGNQLCLKERAELISKRQRQEAEAESFAAWLLVPEDELEFLRQAEGENLHSWKISEHFQVPNEMVRFRLGLSDNAYLKSIGW